jgi:transposase
LQALGPEVVQGLKFVCSEMWQPYLQVIAKQAKQAVHVLDRFHITQHLNKAVDEVRRGESSRLRAADKIKAEQLKGMRWKLLRRGASVRGRARLDVDREQVIQDRRSGMSLTQVAEKHAISRASVCRLMKDHSEKPDASVFPSPSDPNRRSDAVADTGAL